MRLSERLKPIDEQLAATADEISGLLGDVEACKQQHTDFYIAEAAYHVYLARNALLRSLRIPSEPGEREGPHFAPRLRRPPLPAAT